LTARHNILVWNFKKCLNFMTIFHSKQKNFAFKVQHWYCVNSALVSSPKTFLHSPNPNEQFPTLIAKTLSNSTSKRKLGFYNSICLMFKSVSKISESILPKINKSLFRYNLAGLCILSRWALTRPEHTFDPQ